MRLENQLPEHLYNVGVGTDVTIKKLAETVQNITGHQGDIIWDTTKPDGTPRKLLDSSKMRKLGWQPNYNLTIGISHTYKWFLNSAKTIKLVNIN